MKLVIAGALAAGMMLASSAFAVNMPPLATQAKCVSCHAIDKKLVGPAWMDVAKKYKGNKKAEAMLVAKVQKGGSGAWGTVAMPPYGATVKEADIKTLVKFILGLAK
jgi:cytochrome c